MSTFYGTGGLGLVSLTGSPTSLTCSNDSGTGADTEGSRAMTPTASTSCAIIPSIMRPESKHGRVEDSAAEMEVLD
jgi:hypothetical protein